MTLLPANLFQWASSSSSFILSFFSFLENARERGEEEISFPVERVLGCLPALGGGREKNSQES